MSSIEATAATDPEMQALKQRLKTTWESGDYGAFAVYLQRGAADFLERLDIQPGTHMLDVACGAGQISVPAARAGAQVTGVDIAANLVEQARSWAREEGVDARFDEGDAEALPYDDASFDLVTSLLGAMFAPQPDRVASELLRVCRPGGRIVMGNWTPEGFVGGMFKIIGKHAPPPPLMAPPVQWGDEATVRQRLATGAEVTVTRRYYPFEYPFGPEAVVDLFRDYYGPAQKALAALDHAGQAALQEELTLHWQQHNQANDGGTRVEAEYLEVVARRC
ncbi:class I SAM-dependent methyltransferase [Spectribacter hydrogenoxidans]|uniref:Class I SAM-dependent methyltransferase n=1 Tax=Spectribacter hydrogenoxidans TaxID=3075608 RepID=A0ABU3BWF9_9GAMM|nr:class I SAM-dependent methyltransferase [Salinisphaera sp. W335]MDT0633629.1 class I SAM-dependent methyltransferase [Salinisphaera sp. W335]